MAGAKTNISLERKKEKDRYWAFDCK
jgi:hypothetical protein